MRILPVLVIALAAPLVALSGCVGAAIGSAGTSGSTDPGEVGVVASATCDAFLKLTYGGTATDAADFTATAGFEAPGSPDCFGLQEPTPDHHDVFAYYLTIDTTLIAQVQEAVTGTEWVQHSLDTNYATFTRGTDFLEVNILTEGNEAFDSDPYMLVAVEPK
jgi:hypothetical protein